METGNMQKITKFASVSLGAILVAFTSAASALTYTTTSFLPAEWGSSDSGLGLEDYIVEDFENIRVNNLVAVGWNTPAGNVAPSSTLPNRFAPQFDDFGDAFEGANGGAWDGSMGVINTRTNNSFAYDSSNDYGSIIIQFSTPVTSVGFSLQQANLPVTLSLNGVDQGNLLDGTGLTPGGSRQGYILITAGAGETISSLELKNSGMPTYPYDDAFMIDHLAFLPVSAPVPEPETYAMLLSGFAMIGMALTRQRRRT
jgi:hypothetical protein